MEEGKAGRSEISTGPVADRNARWSRRSDMVYSRLIRQTALPALSLQRRALRRERLAGLVLVALDLKIQRFNRARGASP